MVISVIDFQQSGIKPFKKIWPLSLRSWKYFFTSFEFLHESRQDFAHELRQSGKTLDKNSSFWKSKDFLGLETDYKFKMNFCVFILPLIFSTLCSLGVAYFFTIIRVYGLKLGLTSLFCLRFFFNFVGFCFHLLPESGNFPWGSQLQDLRLYFQAKMWAFKRSIDAVFFSLHL